MFGAVDVNLRAERAGAIGKLAVFHACEKVETFLDAAIAERAFLGVAAVFIRLLRRQVANVGPALFDQLHGVIVDLVEIIARVERFERLPNLSAIVFCDAANGSLPVRHAAEDENPAAVAGDGFGRFAFRFQAEPVFGPAADEPVHVLGDGIHVFDVFLGRVGVVHAQVADAAEFAGDAEVQADAFGVADVQVAVRFRRKAGVNARIFLFGDVFRHDVANEIGRGGGRRIFCVRIAHVSGAG